MKFLIFIFMLVYLVSPIDVAPGIPVDDIIVMIGSASVLIGDVLKDMYASEDRNVFARNLLEPLFIEETNNRQVIITPSEEELRYEMKETLQGVVFIH